MGADLLPATTDQLQTNYRPITDEVQTKQSFCLKQESVWSVLCLVLVCLLPEPGNNGCQPGYNFSTTIVRCRRKHLLSKEHGI
jgi:hypothetical protein